MGKKLLLLLLLALLPHSTMCCRSCTTRLPLTGHHPQQVHIRAAARVNVTPAADPLADAAATHQLLPVLPEC
jgi:hypothetical protein